VPLCSRSHTILNANTKMTMFWIPDGASVKWVREILSPTASWAVYSRCEASFI
jgi:hypothetical protein